MKTTFKTIASFTIVISLLFMFSCSEESSVETIQTETKIHVIKKSNLSLDKIKEKSILLTTINALSLKQEEYKKSSKLVYDSINEFYIDTDNIILQEGDLGKSYTFSIIRENESPYIENLTIHINDQNQSMALLTIYNLSETEKNIILNNGVVPNINQKLLVFPINELPSQFLSGYTHKETTDTTAINVYQLPNGQCGVIDHIESLGDEGSIIYYTIVECPTENSGGSSNSDSSSSSSTGFTFGYDYTISNNESSSGNTNQTTGGGSSSGNYITPYVMPADQLRKKEFLINLKSNDINAFNWFNQQSSETQNAILTYLEDSLNNDGLVLTEYSQEAVEFVKQLIQNSIKTGLHFDIKKSSKSPANVDVTAIDSTTTEGRIFNCIFDKLSKSPKFKNLYNAIFNDTDKINVKFEIANLNSTTKGGDTQAIYTYNSNNQIIGIKNRIRINSYILNNNSTLYVANAIIHEMLHAYLNVQQIGFGTDIYNLNNYNTLGDILVENANGTINITTNGATTNSHAFMFDYMIPAFTAIYNEILNELTTQNDLDYNSDVSMPGTNTLFNVNDMLYYLSTGGLDKDKNGINNSNYQTEIGNFPDKVDDRAEYITKVKNFIKKCN